MQPKLWLEIVLHATSETAKKLQEEVAQQGELGIPDHPIDLLDTTSAGIIAAIKQSSDCRYSGTGMNSGPGVGVLFDIILWLMITGYLLKTADL